MPENPHSSVHRMHGIPANSHLAIKLGIVKYELMYIIETLSCWKLRQSANKDVLWILVMLVPWVGGACIKIS